MDRDLREKIRRATESSGIEKSDFIDLLRLVDEHYDRMEATITQSLTTTTPIESVFDSVTEALMSVSDTGIIRICNKVCARYFGLTKDQIIGSQIEHLLPGAKDKDLAEFLSPYMSSPDDTRFEFRGGDVEARRSDGNNAQETAARDGAFDDSVKVALLRTRVIDLVEFVEAEFFVVISHVAGTSQSICAGNKRNAGPGR